MKIEKITWAWPDAVKRKDVRRDYELIRTATKEEALEAIDMFFKNKRGYHYVLTVFHNGEYITYNFPNMPCLGGLAKYKDAHGDKYFMNPYLPRDIYYMFPEGTPVFIGLYRQNIGKDVNNPYLSFSLSQESPWISAFGYKSTIIVKDNYIVLTNMNTDPTVFYHLWQYGGLRNPIRQSPWDLTFDNPKAQFLWMLRGSVDPVRFCNQNPICISGGTWAEGYGYTRPYNDNIFMTTLPPLEEFKKLSTESGTFYSGPNNTKLKQFFDSKGVPMNTCTKEMTKQVEKILLEAWEFFKQPVLKEENGNA